MAGSAPVPAGAAPVACTGALWGRCRALAEAQRERSESECVVGYLAADLARATGRDVSDIIDEARGAIRDLSEWLAAQKEVAP